MENQRVRDELKKRGFKFTNSSNRKKINSFEESDISNRLFNFLQRHPSCRVFFNAFLKSGKFEIEYKTLEKLSDYSQTSFLLKAQCDCEESQKRGAGLTRINLVDIDFNLEKLNAEISCYFCGYRKKISKENYSFDYDFKRDQILKMSHLMMEEKILTQYANLMCFSCGNITNISEKDLAKKEIDFHCHCESKTLRELRVVYLPSPK